MKMAIHFGGAEGRLATGVRQRLTQACLDADRQDEAAPLVEEALRLALQISGNASRDAGIGYRQRAQLRAAQQRTDEALADLRTAEDIFLAMGANGRSQIQKIHGMRKRVEDASSHRADPGTTLP
jgi:hypothetical protein